jgi:LCP family protein required for cell wall assembly
VSRDRFEQDDVARPLPPRLDPRAGRPPRDARPDRADAGPSEGRRRGRVAVSVRVIGGVLSLLLLVTTGWGWYLGRVAEATVKRTDAIPGSGNTGIGSQSAMNLLLVGNDSRADLTKAQLAQLNAGVPSGTNTDTMILVHIPADGSRASFVSFPRDSYVQIPGHGRDKLNSAYAYGYEGTPASEPEAQRRSAGEQLLVQTISGLTGLQIDHYAEVDLLGFFKLATVVGGVQVNLCAPVHDHYSGAHFPAGVQTISGADALRFVRQRHGLLRGDFDRIIRQQVFLAAVLRKMLSSNVAMDLGKQRQLVSAVAQSVTVDRNLDLMQLAQQMQSVTAGKIQFQTLPYVGDSKDSAGRYILKLKDDDTLHAFFAQLSADPAPAGSKAAGSTAVGSTAAAPTSAAPAATIAPAAVKVQVFNGSGTPGLAAGAAAALRDKGFRIGRTGNADATTYRHTEIRYAAGDQALAASVAASIPGASTTQSPNPSPGTVQVILGSDFTRIGTAVPAVAPTSTPAVSGEDARTAANTNCVN